MAVTLPPYPQDVREAMKQANQLAYGFDKHVDANYWRHYPEDRDYFWRRMLGEQAGPDDAPRFGLYANPQTPWHGVVEGGGEQLDENSIRKVIRQAYLDMLHREPDPGGWDHWTHEMLVNGMTLDQVKEALKGDPAYVPPDETGPGSGSGTPLPPVADEIITLMREIRDNTKRTADALDVIVKRISNL